MKSQPQQDRVLPFGICVWFAKCLQPATGYTSHPVLGELPTCDRCHKFATGEDRK